MSPLRTKESFVSNIFLWFYLTGNLEVLCGRDTLEKRQPFSISKERQMMYAIQLIFIYTFCTVKGLFCVCCIMEVSTVYLYLGCKQKENLLHLVSLQLKHKLTERFESFFFEEEVFYNPFCFYAIKRHKLRGIFFYKLAQINHLVFKVFRLSETF